MSKQQIVDVRYEFTEAELKAAMILNSGTIEMLRTLIADAKQQRFNLAPSPDKYQEFIQQEAEIKGAISAYQHLLDAHNDALTSTLDPQSPVI